jgi:aminopeptidase-like protein
MRKSCKQFLLIASVLFTFSAVNAQEPSNLTVDLSVNSTNIENDYIVSSKDVHEELSYLASDDLQGRATGSEGIEKAAVYIENIFRENGITPYFETYRDNFEVKNKQGFNIVGLLEGKDEILKKEFIVIGAHYDHIGLHKEVDGDSIANGANDNAAGTVAVIELAKQFAKLDTKRSVLFVLFSGEEMGLQGSKHLAKKMHDSKLDIYVMFNIEMIGVPMKTTDYRAYITGYEMSNLAEKFNEYSNETILGFLPKAKEYQLFKRSDNYPFYKEYKIPAQTISTFDFTNYNFYHHVDDEVEKMDPEFMAELIGDLMPGLIKMSNTPEKEIKIN